jgi:3-oxoacyl-[acyl-carrier-protein] synthase-3
MFTKARELHQVALEVTPALIHEALERCGIDYSELDVLIPHQTSSRLIESAAKMIAGKLGAEHLPWVDNIRSYGNTSSTTHFVALYRYLQEKRLKFGDKIMLLSHASGLEFGTVVFTMDGLLERYGNAD